jgi:carbonic anhydrase
MGEELINADEALHKLLEGNERFVKGQPANPRRSPEDFRGLAEAQYPKAVIVSCADSRVAPEILFDVGVGDIFVVRVAGNVVSGAGVTVKGSIEYAVAELNVPLIVVLGHTGCGAVKAAMKHMMPGIRCRERSMAWWNLSSLRSPRRREHPAMRSKTRFERMWRLVLSGSRIFSRSWRQGLKTAS